ncbi:MAG: GGDEF domain-containing protein [Sulfurimonadaceae bacterium]|jgi:diguanylate cyclase (GGDEF)-like protein|nr:GGDEF domain-containing protein [Sulfurimonadaceae bacterium]
MKTKQKLLLIVTIMLLGLTAATIVNISLNFREYSIKSAVDKSRLTANIVKDGLTAHMVNGTMDQRQYFLDQISQHDDVKSLWIIRSAHVIEQYGKGFNHETARDVIDQKVLDSGEMVQNITEKADEIVLRVTIPYKATTTGTPNCLSCHDVARGDTLGAISMEFNISSMRTTGMLTIIKILSINLLFLIVVLFLINHYITPYTQLFSNLQEGIKKAHRGDFTHTFTSKVGGDAQKVVTQMDTLFGKMQETFGDLKYNLETFIPKGCGSSNDPLYEAKGIIGELSDIYKFKKTIELDASKDEIYTRIIDILKLKFHLENFALYEVNNVISERKLIYISEGESICISSLVDNNPINCRAYRTASDVISTEFANLCRTCEAGELKYVCIPFSINAEASLIISITAKTQDEMSLVNSHILSIKNYLEAAKPVIESRILTDKLRDTSLKDGMTGLYNRRFLEEFIDKLMGQASRLSQTYHVLMLDVDFFKMVNDTYGHDVGDKVIVALANIIRDSIRESDLAIRYGGEEFLVMLHNATDEGALKIARNIHERFGAIVFEVGVGESIQKTISIGIAKFPTDGDTIWKCIKYADTALYAAKNTGRNKIVPFEAQMFKGEDF